MRSLTLTALLALVSATPTPLLPARQDSVFPYPTVATYEAVLRRVDPEYQAYLQSNVVIRLDNQLPRIVLNGPATSSSSKRAAEERQSRTCDVRGFAIVNGDPTPFQATVQNPASNFGRAVSVTGILSGCRIGVVPQSDCGLWSITDTSGCATARSVTFS